MSDDGEPPAKRSKDSLGNDPESRNEMQLFETMGTTQLLDLHDYCLDEIFLHLDVIDLCSVANVCIRFEQLAVSFYKRKFSEIDFSAVFADRLISSEEASDVLRHFGHVIKSVTIPRKVLHNHDIVGHVEEGLLNVIVECCGKTLHTLKLKNFLFTSHAVDTLNMLSESLKSLSLVECDSAGDCVSHLSNFSSLTSLTITDTRDCSYALVDAFPALKYFKLNKVSIQSYRILQQFIVTQKQLKALEITHCDGIPSDVFRSIGKYMENLTALNFAGFFRMTSEPIVQILHSIQHLGELKNMQRFSWYSGFYSIGNLLAKMVTNKISLKSVALNYCVMNDETIKAIKQMKNLERVSFLRTHLLENKHLIEIELEVPQLKKIFIVWQPNITFDGLKGLLRHAKHLMNLRIVAKDFRLDPTMYTDILDIVKERRNGIKLIISIASTDAQDLISQQRNRMNRNWLMIDIINTQRSNCNKVLLNSSNTMCTIRDMTRD